ncbi:MAG: ferritin family protein, partial [Nitrospinota bacterium]
DFSAYRAQLEDVNQKAYSSHQLEPFSNFSLEKVLNVAITKEKKASQHYLHLGENEKNSEIKKLFMELANEEKHHSLYIGRILSSLNMDDKDRPAL